MPGTIYSIGPTNVTAATVTVGGGAPTGKLYVLNRAAGIAVTLPAATGSGNRYEFIVQTTVSSNSTTIKVDSADATMDGVIFGAADGGNTVNGWETAATSDTITLNGSTTGGLAGDRIVLTDIAANVWAVTGWIAQTGTEATPFSATVS
jgi:fructose-specific component phosphotransferase system IIB-like protein